MKHQQEGKSPRKEGDDNVAEAKAEGRGALSSSEGKRQGYTTKG